ncbi:MAG TPA: TetM/TetW/TetO/TetS family tetracycline resistance ribosomal protection protein [Candidatus Merdivicinus intestinigallinarum]|nr:TetM/TetW/TetO/TetS family tetracycline resistance ribosomal protection protein [Candidatus Merdivicinus intestinigallinarum]
MDEQEPKKGAKVICAGLLAHADAGKTTLTEQLLYIAGAIRKAGSVDDGTAQTDWLDVERRRGISVRAASSRLTLGDTAVNLIDTPGHADFSGEVERSLGALDGAVLLLSAVEGVQAQTKLIWKAMDTLRLPGIIFLNKIDRAGSDCKKVLSQLAREFPGSRFFPMQSVRGEGKIDAAVSGPDWEDASFQENLLLELADFDPEIEEAVLNEEQPPLSNLQDSLKRAVAARQMTPVFFGSAKTGVGCRELLDGMVSLLPPAPQDTDAPLSGLVYKVEYDPVMGKAAHIRLLGGKLQNRDPVPVLGQEEPEKITQIRRRMGEKTQDIGEITAGDIGVVYGLSKIKTGDIIGTEPLNRACSIATPLLQVQVYPEKPEELPALVEALRQLSDEDPLLDLLWLPEERELHIKITGVIQLEVLEELIAQRFGLKAAFSKPTVIYKETPAHEGIGYESYTWPKPCWAQVELKIEPLPRGSGIQYESAIKEKQIFYRYQNHIKTSVFQNLKQGVYGWEVTDAKITLVGGSHHTIHTHPLDFFVATPVALLDGLTKCGSILLEPMLAVQMTAPEEVLGRVLGDITAMRGEFDTPVIANGEFTLEARLPAADSIDYPIAFRSLTSGKGLYSTRFDGYQECPLELGKTCPRRGIDPLDRAKWILWARNAITG